MQWRIAEAKRRFSELVRSASDEPQLILNRDRVVAAVVDASLLEGFIAWRAQRQRATLADGSAELRRVCAEEGYTLELPPRRDRPNAFADALADPSV